MNTIIWSRVSSTSQDNQRQILNLKQVAAEKGWTVKRVFEETVSGTVKTTERKEFNKLLEYSIQNDIKLILVSEISRIGRKVVDILTTVETFHKKGIALYIQQFNMISFQDGKENQMVMMLLQMLSIGAELENNQRKERQREGIALAKLQQKYEGRKKGAKADKQKLLSKYSKVVDLINKSELSIRRIADITEHSINTVRMVKKIVNVG